MIVRPSVSRLYRLANQPQCCQYTTQCSRVRPSPIPSISSLFRPHRNFSTSRHLNDSSKPVNHYEVLGVKPDASKGELKKQFYKLSKETHPDLHKDDPTASERFSQISESYSILGNDEKRRRYDRDFARQNPGAPAGRSGTYAGSRPPSGLSKRRGTFRGAPQSFYAQGGYGNTGRQSSNTQQAEYQPGTFDASAYTERGQFNPDFNADPVYRTQSAEDARRARRMQAAIDMEAIEATRNDSLWLRFVIVSTIVVAGVSVGAMIVSMSNAPRGGMLRADGSKRDGPKNVWAKG